MCQVNIKVTVIVWLVEFLGSIILVLDFLVIGNRSNALRGLFRILIMLLFFVLLPCTFLINCSETKNAIVDHNWGDALVRMFKSPKVGDQRRSPDGSNAPKKASHTTSSRIFTISNANLANNDGVINESNKENNDSENKSVASKKRQRKEAWN